MADLRFDDMSTWGHAEDWTPEQIGEWKRRSAAGEARLQPHASTRQERTTFVIGEEWNQ